MLRTGLWELPMPRMICAMGARLPSAFPLRRNGTIAPSLRRSGDMRYTRISADCHIDMPWLPADLFTANASAAMKDRMPYVTDGPDGPRWTTKKGAVMGLVGGLGSSGQKYVPGQNHRVDVMASTGLFADGRNG